MDHTFDEYHPVHVRIRNILNDGGFTYEAQQRATMIDDEAAEWLESELISTIRIWRVNSGEVVTLIIHEGYDKDPQYGAELAHVVMIGGDDWDSLRNCVQHAIRSQK